MTLDIQDLDEDASPEDIMLSYVSGDKSKDRTDREVVTPWFRFLWESYRSVLEILRTNPKLEQLYAMTANRAFSFCITYRRTAEFRRLCDILRQHLSNITKYRDQRDLSQQPESLQLHMDLRFEQLRTACDLELWGEAFRSVEDIQGLIALGKKQPKQSMMATYYARLTQVRGRRWCWLVWPCLVWRCLRIHRAFLGNFAMLIVRIQCWAAGLDIAQRLAAGCLWPSGLLGWQQCIYSLSMSFVPAPSGSLTLPASAPFPQIFEKSESHLYHAFAWLKLFLFSRAFNKNLTPSDGHMMACSVLLATLSILPYDRTDVHSEETDKEKERIQRMANILGFPVVSGWNRTCRS